MMYLLSLLFIFNCEAKLAHSSLDDFINQSTLILEASPLLVSRKKPDDTSGSAKLSVTRVHFGSYKKKTITINWSPEVHDQHINFERDYLLFLKKGKDGKWTGSHYGRGYWPFWGKITSFARVDLDSESRRIEYVYPVSMVKLSKEEKKMLKVKGDPRDQPTINFRALLKHVNSLKK